MRAIDRAIFRILKRMTAKDREEVEDGGKGSGNFNHAGRPGEVGGSAPSKGSSASEFIPKKGSDRYYRHQGWNRERHEYLESKGHSSNDVKDFERLIERHIQSPHQTDSEVAEFVKKHPALIKDIAEYEREAANVRAEMDAEEIDKNIEDAKQDAKFYKSLMPDEAERIDEDTQTQIERLQRKKSLLKDLRMYRKGDYDSPVLSFTSNPNGATLYAGTENETNLFPDHSDTLDDLMKQGIVPVSGFGAIQNFYGEGEVTFVKLPTGQEQSASPKYSDEMSEKGYVGLSGAESDAFMEKYHNKSLIGSRTGNTMSGGQSRRINSALRSGKMPSDPDDAKLVERLDVAIKRNQLPQDMTLFRGIGANALANTGLFSDWKEKHVKWSDYTLPNGKHDFDGWEKAEIKAENENIQGLLSRAKKLIGKEITDDGFMQTSASSERNIFAFSDFNLQIHAPKGTNAYISNYKLESEIILGRGTTLKITDATVATVKLKNGNQKKVVQLIAEVVPSNKTHRTMDSWTFADYEVEDGKPEITDEEVWRSTEEGKHFKIETTTGEIKAGFGGRLNGQKIRPKGSPKQSEGAEKSSPKPEAQSPEAPKSNPKKKAFSSTLSKNQHYEMEDARQASIEALSKATGVKMSPPYNNLEEIEKALDLLPKVAFSTRENAIATEEFLRNSEFLTDYPQMLSDPQDSLAKANADLLERINPDVDFDDPSDIYLCEDEAFGRIGEKEKQQYLSNLFQLVTGEPLAINANAMGSAADAITKLKAVSANASTEDIQKTLSECGAFRAHAIVDLSGCEPEYARGVAKSMQTIMEKYPFMYGKFGGMTAGDLKDSVYAHCQGDNITLNTDFYANSSKFERSQRLWQYSGFHPIGTGTDYIATHEMAHVIDNYIETFIGVKPSELILGQVARKMNMTPSQVQESVSGYACKNAQEFFAESIGELLHSKYPREVAGLVGKELEAIIEDGGLRND